MGVVTHLLTCPRLAFTCVSVRVCTLPHTRPSTRQRCYREAISIRERVLPSGHTHVDTITAIHNLAELLLAQGTEEHQREAATLQADILQRLGQEDTTTALGGSDRRENE